MSRKRKRKQSKWTPPENYMEYFSPSSDDAFKAAHPWGYFFLVVLALAVLFLPAVLFCYFAWTDDPWLFLGAVGGVVFGIGLTNFVAIIIDQYLGHWVSILCFTIGSIMMLASYLLCRPI